MLAIPLSFWVAITNLGDSFVLAPIAIVLTAWIAMACSVRAAAQFLLLLGAGLFMVGATKVAFLGWGLGIAPIDFTGISGHSTFSAAIYPLGAYLLGARASRRWSGSAVLLGTVLTAAIALSRVVLHAHSASESLAGWLLGTSICMAWIGLRHQGGTLRNAPASFAIAIAMFAVALHGRHAPTQQMITRVALDLSGRSSPFVRVSWLADKAEKRRAMRRCAAAGGTMGHSATSGRCVAGGRGGIGT